MTAASLNAPRRDAPLSDAPLSNVILTAVMPRLGMNTCCSTVTYAATLLPILRPAPPAAAMLPMLQLCYLC